VGFIQLGKEVHTSSLVQSLARSFFLRSLSGFTRFLGKNAWAMDEILATALHKFFHTLKVKARSVVFLLLDDTIIQKTGKKIPGCAWYKDHAQNLATVLATDGSWPRCCIKRLFRPWNPASTPERGQGMWPLPNQNHPGEKDPSTPALADSLQTPCSGR
jgi:hypothetical protein